MTIVRPSHTYDRTLIPLEGGWTTLDRMRRGKPIVVHGDGTSLWTLTHTRDFARAFVGLFGNPHAIGDAVQITSDESLTWDAIAGLLGARARRRAATSCTSRATRSRGSMPEMGAGLLGDKAHSVRVRQLRIKSLVPGWVATTPFAEGAREIVDWYLADAGAAGRSTPTLDAAFDRLARRRLGLACRAAARSRSTRRAGAASGARMKREEVGHLSMRLDAPRTRRAAVRVGARIACSDLP